MDSARRRRIDDICDAALALAAIDRQAFVASACGNDETLRSEVEALLAHAEQSDGFSNTPRPDRGEVTTRTRRAGGRTTAWPMRSCPHQCGRHGGCMGARHQTRPGRAIKVIASAAPADADHMSRFEREAHSRPLNHPHISAIYGPKMSRAFERSCWSLSKARRWRTACGGRPSLPAALRSPDIAAARAAHEKGVIHAI